MSNMEKHDKNLLESSPQVKYFRDFNNCLSQNHSLSLPIPSLFSPLSADLVTLKTRMTNSI